MSGSTLFSGADAADWSSQRLEMVRSIDADLNRLKSVMGQSRLSQEVRHAVSTVPRHLFVPPQFKAQAYYNNPLPIGHKQTISQPTIVALMTELLAVDAGDGYAGLPECAPFDGIMVTAAPDTLPQTLLDQLKPGGRLVAPVGPRDATQWLNVWLKNEDGTCEIQKIIPVRFVPMVREATD